MSSENIYITEEQIKNFKPTYLMIKQHQLYKSKGLKLPKGLYMKSDEYLESLKYKY